MPPDNYHLKLRENFYKITIVILLLGFWGYLLYPLVADINVRPEFSEILNMGESLAKFTKYFQTSLVALAGLLAAILLIKLISLYFNHQELIREKKQRGKQVKKYKQTHQELSDFADVTTEPFACE